MNEFSEIIFVCPSNRALSPFAALFTRQLLPAFSCSSSGCFVAPEGAEADRRAIEAAAKLGFDLGQHRTQKFRLPVNHDVLILTTDADCYWAVSEPISAAAKTSPSVRLLTEYSSDKSLGAIPDPTVGEASFEHSFSLIADLCTALAAKIDKKGT